ncbi:MAG: phosphoenolpyruvate--protein phosphotransferase [Shewanella sp.]|uniref:phosphoenolpyruvate--protein phosphotransferase n=1 Tax=Shewanella sp. SNU WT4 TaxID=2590015 RepID=UPI00112E30EE|nr:phosphoenolpyruvate--protein phosphotransferase [Shewanella sp. SNU WT4]QDF66300.1 phosphoenolpyruvate--protein phosphotransferase [Shewanella sp. SNU WT4]
MLNTLRDITQAVASAPNLEQALTLLVTQTKQAMNTDCCSIYLLEQQQLLLSATDGLLASAVGQVSVPLDQALVGLVAQKEEVLNLANAHLHPRFKLIPEVCEEHYQAFLAVPVVYQKAVVGVLVVQQTEARLFSEHEESFLMTLAAQLAMAISSQKQKQQRYKNYGAIQAQHQILYHGKTASKGIAIAYGLVLGAEIAIAQPDLPCDNLDEELARLESALQRSRDDLSVMASRFEHELNQDISSIFTAMQMLLDDASLGGEFRQSINQGWRAETAVSRVCCAYILQFENMEDVYLKGRAADIRDLGMRVLRQLIEPERVALTLDKPVILLAREVTTGMLAEFSPQKLAGIVTEWGGTNSHAAILARALGIPALVGVEQLFDADLNNKLMVINANRGQLLVSPSPAVVSEYRMLISAEKALAKEYAAELALPTCTLDGYRIQLYLNAGLISGVVNDLANGADGIGLYRTEILFMLQQSFPSEAEQMAVYQQVLSAANGKRVVLRTLDVGGDKPLPYFPINEDNPFLGWRGIRLSLDHPELFLIQIRAMLRASIGQASELYILLPMVSCLDEVEQALAIFDQAWQEINLDSEVLLRRPKVGAMIEVPAILYQIDQLAQLLDFVSVGTNDLTQYLLAVDRNNPRVSSLYDSYHPGFLRALRRASFDCQQNQLEVSVCGELAGETLGALILVAMGFDKLSMNQGSLARVNYLLRRISRTDLSAMLEQILRLHDGNAVRQHLLMFLDQRGLAGLI